MIADCCSEYLPLVEEKEGGDNDDYDDDREYSNSSAFAGASLQSLGQGQSMAMIDSSTSLMSVQPGAVNVMAIPEGVDTCAGEEESKAGAVGESQVQIQAQVQVQETENHFPTAYEAETGSGIGSGEIRKVGKVVCITRTPSASSTGSMTISNTPNMPNTPTASTNKKPILGAAPSVGSATSGVTHTEKVMLRKQELARGIRVVSVTNRFKNQAPHGYRDVLIVFAVDYQEERADDDDDDDDDDDNETKVDTSPVTVKVSQVLCELQVHHADMLQYSNTLRSSEFYRYVQV